MPKRSRSASICDSLRKTHFVHVGRGFLPLLAVMLLAAPQLAFAQENLAVTVNPRTLEIDEGGFDTYTILLDSAPSEDVTITVVGAPVLNSPVTDDEPIVVESDSPGTTTGDDGSLVLTFAADGTAVDAWSVVRTVTVTANEDLNAVSETMTITHSATIDDDAVAVNRVSVRVTVKDNTPKGVTIVAELNLDSELVIRETASGTYTVALDSEPAGMVTVDIGGVSGELSVSPSRLFFTPGNPENYAAKTVTVYAGEDFDGDDDSATLTHTVRGGDYTGERVESVKVSVDDNDIHGVTVTPMALAVFSGSSAYRSATYTVVLNTQPVGSVNIIVSKPDEDAVPGISHVGVSRSSLTFRRNDWNSPQSVTVSVPSTVPVDDQGDPVLPTSDVTLTHAVNTTGTGRDEGYKEASASTEPDVFSSPGDVTVSIGTEPPAAMSLPSTLTVTEGRTNTYRITVSNPPQDGLDVTVGGFENTDVTVDTDPEAEGVTTDLIFNEENKTRTVTVMAAEDPDGERDTVRLTHTVGGNVLRVLTVTITDNDPKGVTVTPTTLDIPEGEHRTYDVSLDTVSTGNVTVTISGASGDVTVDKSQLTFTPENSRLTQQVTVTAEEDADGEPDTSVTLRHTVRGADYGRITADSVRVTIEENETRSIVATPATLMVDEGGDPGEYTVELGSQPTGTVTVMVRDVSGDITVRPSRLTFTTSTWDDPQTVTVSASEDADGEPDPAVTLTHAASGGGYNGVTGGTVTVTISEDDGDKKGLTITPSALRVPEGSADSYTVVLNTQPRGSVTVTLSRSDAASMSMQSLTVTPMTLTFAPRNWNVPQRVTVRAPEDDNAVDESVTLTHSSRGGGYDSTDDPGNNPTLLREKTVAVTAKDNDEAGLTVTPRRLEIPLGSTQTYTVALKTRPAGTVTVTIGDPGSGVTRSPESLVFRPGNWSEKRKVTVHAPATASAGTVTVSNTPTSTESGDPPAYSGGVPNEVDVTAVVMGTDAVGIAVNPTSLTITEGGSASYTMVLTKLPSESVTVTPEKSYATNEVRVTRSVRFTTSDWNREKTVTVSLSEDSDSVADAALTLVHKVTGADEYEDIEEDVTPVTVEFEENDTRGVTVSPTSLTIAAGTSGTYRVRLNTEPSAATTVTVNHSTDVIVEPVSFEFTENNWSREQTVKVTVDEDAGGEEERSVTLSHTVTGSDYAGVGVSDVTVRIPVEGVPSEPRGLSATAGPQRVTLRWSAPSSDGGSAINRYEYRSRESGGSYGEWATVSGGASATSHTVTGLDNGISYEFQVRARNAIGPGPESNEASATLDEAAPGAPAGLTATAGDESVTLNWSAPADGGSQILRYEYSYAASGETFSDWATVSGGPNSTSLTVSGLTNGTEYGFRVRAVNSIGEGPHASASATPGRAPSMPTGLTASVESETITVMWGMPTDTGGSSVTGYQVRYRMNGGGWSNWMTVAGGASATSYTMTGLTNGIGHEIEVRAVNAIGTGASASVEATPMEGIDFAHFANGQSTGVTITSDIVLVNVETSTVTPAIYFYNQKGEMIPADSVVDLMGGLEMAGDGSLAVPMGIAGRGEMTISTNGEGALVIGSVRVFGSGRLGGVLRFDIPFVGVAGVGASEPVNDAIFPARRMVGGINTGAAIRNLSSEPMTVTCMLMQGGDVMDTKMVRLAGDGHSSEFIHEMFPGSNTTDFVGSVRCTAADGGMFAGVALELDAPNGIFTTLPVVPLNTGSDSGESMLNFAHFANGDFAGTATSSDLVFVNVASSAVSPAIYFYDQMGNMIDASMVVDAMMDGVEVDSDGALMVMDEIPPMGEMTISTSGMGDGMIGSVRVVADGPIGGVLRFDIPNIGVAGVGASEAVNAAIFPARRMMNGINTGAAIRNLMAEMTTVTCRLMKGGNPMGENPIKLPGNGQNSEFINELFPNANTDDFEGSVHCTAPAGSMFTGVALGDGLSTTGSSPPSL